MNVLWCYAQITELIDSYCINLFKFVTADLIHTVFQCHAMQDQKPVHYAVIKQDSD